jgi:primary-amine oxidase
MFADRKKRVMRYLTKKCPCVAEYLSYVTFGLDGSISFDLKLTGELSTNLPAPQEEASGSPEYGTLVAPGVCAQLHQHQFCYRLDVAVDGPCNRVIETTLQPLPISPTNPYGNAIKKCSTTLKTELGAKRQQLPPGGSWRIENAAGVKNTVNGQPTAYKLMPNTRGSPQPLLLTDPQSAVSMRGGFATASLWVTPYSASERFPAGTVATTSLPVGP